MEDIVFRREDKKYSDLWRNNYKEARWKKLASVLAKEVHPSQGLIADFGFGNGSAFDYFEKKGFKVEGVDISSYVVDLHKRKGRKVHCASLDHMPQFEDNRFLAGFCNDVIEHVPENVVEKAIYEMSRVCSDNLFISVCPTPSHHLSLEGENLHLTIKPKEWWEDQFSKVGKVQKIPFFLSRSLRYKLNLKK